MAEAWERQLGESGPAWAAFVAYRDLGPERTVVAVCKVVGKSQTLLHKWSQHHHWKARALELDRRNEAIERRAADRERAKRAAAVERHRLDALERKRKLGKLMTERSQETLETATPIEISIADAIKLGRLGPDLEREYVDESTYDPDLDGVDITKLTPDQAAEYQERLEADRAARRKVQVSKSEGD